MKSPLHPATQSDLDAILALERATENAPHWPLSAYAAILDDPASPRCLIVADAGDAIAGFAVGLMGPTAAAELESVVVAANCRRAGIGRSLCSAVLDWCRTRGATEAVLEVRAASTGAIALYASLGFAETGRRPRYYRDPEDDAILMRLQLDPSGPRTVGGSR
jgi:[ribosomal protein S18]-alanine N-acetyltransferase